MSSDIHQTYLHRCLYIDLSRGTDIQIEVLLVIYLLGPRLKGWRVGDAKNPYVHVVKPVEGKEVHWGGSKGEREGDREQARDDGRLQR